MEIIIALIIGGLIGWVASLVMGTGAQMGIVANIVVGLIGSWLGFYLAPKAGIIPVKGSARWVVAIGGAVLLILILKVLGIYS
jgi:uncharacterized membrane protein YeaQ/YmgE (transglycosylase-associated protein family)